MAVDDAVTAHAERLKRKIGHQSGPHVQGVEAGAIAASSERAPGLAIGPASLSADAILADLASRLPGLHVGHRLDPLDAAVLWQIRAPRVILGALVGAMLAGGGAAYQGVFRNPLADPYLLGVAAGAGLGATLIIVGGGNSAGQAAVYLSQTAGKVHILVRAAALSDTMSRYLIRRIEENPAIELHYQTELIGLEGDEHLERITWQDRKTGQTSVHNIRHVFVMAGASPRTAWLKGCVALDKKGFILTGRDLDEAAEAPQWPLARHPLMLETSLPGVFAVGDVRAGNVKRVAAAVGEGSIAINLVHRALAEL